MHTAVIIPFHFLGNLSTLHWALEGYAQQQLSPSHTMEIWVGIDGGQGAELRLPELAGLTCRCVSLALVGSAAVRNALIKQTSVQTELLVFADPDVRPDSAMVQAHIDATERLPPGTLVLGSVFREQLPEPRVIDAFLDETSARAPFPPPKAGSWHNWRAACMENLSMRRAPFVAAGGFPEALRPRYFEDFVLARRLMGDQPRVCFEPAARGVRRQSLTFEQYLDQDEGRGIMAPVLARVAPECFGKIYGGAPAATLAQRYVLWTQMDRPLHQAAYRNLCQWMAQPAASLGQGPQRALTLSALYHMHMPLKCLAARMGFLRGLQMVDDSQWTLRAPQGLWREALVTG